MGRGGQRVAGVKRHILIVHSALRTTGGMDVVCAWAIQALHGVYEVSLATLEPVDCTALNRDYGTTLPQEDFRVLIAPAGYQRARRWVPTRGAFLDISLNMRWARQLDRRNRYDVLLGTENEIDFGRPGLHYVHHPTMYFPRPRHEMRWFHYLPGMLWAYRQLGRSISGMTDAGLRRNLALANSEFIRQRIHQVHGVDATILYPPVPGHFDAVAWGDRQAGFVAIGRLDGAKRWEMALQIVEQLRSRGRDLGFTLIGHAHPSPYLSRLRSLAATRPWFRIYEHLTRDQLVAEVPRHRYALHTFENEHFGIGPAEVQNAGCILFAHNSGGPIEIVDDARRLFDNVADAVAKIERMLDDHALEVEFQRRVVAQRERFSTTRFCDSLRTILTQFERTAPAQGSGEFQS